MANEDTGCPPHCCCCGPGDVCCDCGEVRRLTPEQAWQDLIEMDDRTSPADEPDMALITFEELAAYMRGSATVA